MTVKAPNPPWFDVRTGQPTAEFYRFILEFLGQSSLGPSGVTPGTYGDGTDVGQFSVNANGVVTSAANVPIASAPKWTTPRTESFSGDVTGGPTTVDGSANWSSPLTIATGVVSYLKMQASTAASILLGRGQGSGAGTLQEITLGSGVSMAGTVLSASGLGGTVTTTGSPANGNLTQFSGSSSITNGDLSGDVTTSGSLATTCLKTNGVAFGTAATKNTGTSGANIPLLNAANTWSAQQTFNFNAAAAPSPLWSDVVLLNGADSTSTAFAGHTYGNALQIGGLRANGTGASRSAVGSGENLVAFLGLGWDGSTYGIGAQIVIQTNQAFTGSARGSNMLLQTVPNGGTTPIIALELASDQGNILGGYFRPKSTTFANIGSVDASPVAGDELVISDASTCTINTAVSAGGGTHVCPVVYNGTNWIAKITN